jgi:hypothetical protein
LLQTWRIWWVIATRIKPKLHAEADYRMPFLMMCRWTICRCAADHLWMRRVFVAESSYSPRTIYSTPSLMGVAVISYSVSRSSGVIVELQS